ncbi:YxeA family protein [Virgibacillus sp. NKC19-3]|uniref:YxeA family protein n=1 Tax=Virgibacillus saliphilus TaxID=2831674 RepID=UPI001C9B762B|nr:YxeA family protein [Virgibacillus sp. NKC19-3]MBY7142428.1 YxeA family protein [Virgibacillus sp. NKC19-3]
MKKLLIVSMGFAICLLSACSLESLQTIGSTKYYVEIDDDGEEYTESNNTRYEYNLMGFDEDGEEKELSFTAGHQLKQGAYLKVHYKKDEVITYEEVDADDVPKKAQELLGEKN